MLGDPQLLVTPLLDDYCKYLHSHECIHAYTQNQFRILIRKAFYKKEKKRERSFLHVKANKLNLTAIREAGQWDCKFKVSLSYRMNGFKVQASENLSQNQIQKEMGIRVVSQW